eukprot:UN16637
MIMQIFIFLAYNAGHIVFCGEMCTHLQNTWRQKSWALRQTFTPVIAGYIAALSEDTKFRESDKVIVILGGNKTNGIVINLNRNGTYRVKLMTPKMECIDVRETNLKKRDDEWHKKDR